MSSSAFRHVRFPFRPVRFGSFGFRWSLVPLALACAVCLGTERSGSAAEPPSPAAAMMKLLQSGKVPEARLPAIVKLVCERGNAEDLAYLFKQAVQDGAWNDPLRIETLTALRDASRNRKVMPAGDVDALAGLLASSNPDLRRIGIELAGEWKGQGTFAALRTSALSADTPSRERPAILTAMARINPQDAKSVLSELSVPERPFALRVQAVSALVAIDVAAAAEQAATVFTAAEPGSAPEPLLDAFLAVRQGSEVLASRIEQRPPAADTAKLLLRHMFSIGRTDPELSAALSRIAGIDRNPVPPTKEELAAMAVEAMAHGDAGRGERVFRRGDLSCMKCHAVSKAGGQIGPDLSAVGSSSPVEYLVASVLDPDQAIKEAYTTKLVLLTDGRIHQGLMADRTAQTLVLKDATGKLTSIPLADIEEEVEGKSLMPKGLVNFMTRGELLDLVKFLSELGKPGDYAVRSTQRMQRWQVLKTVPAALSGESPDPSTFDDLVTRSDAWTSVYSLVNGNLPTADLAIADVPEWAYVRGEFAVTAPGEVLLSLNSVTGLEVWVDGRPVATATEIPVIAESGTHAIVLKVNLATRGTEPIRLELRRPSGSKVEFAVVDGQ